MIIPVDNSRLLIWLKQHGDRDMSDVLEDEYGQYVLMIGKMHDESEREVKKYVDLSEIVEFIKK
jgi:hypothetical protein